jgi:transcriptional regulator
MVAFMQRYSFATIVAAKDHLPVAGHLPLVVRDQGDQILFTGHFAKANEQWQLLEGGKVLVIFNEPHAYVSPRHYDQTLNVPTWNYLAVHAYGLGHIIREPKRGFEILESMMDTYEPEYRKQWDALPATYKQKMFKGIVSFEIEVTELQGKKKLSQNKSDKERSRIIAAFSNSGERNEQEIADYMKDQEAAEAGL